MAAVRPAPKIAAASTASKMPGNANRMSRPEEITASAATQRRQAAVTARISVPTGTLIMTTASGPSIEDCVPASSRDATSRPSKSKPSTWPPTGPTQASDKVGRLGS